MIRSADTFIFLVYTWGRGDFLRIDAPRYIHGGEDFDIVCYCEEANTCLNFAVGFYPLRGGSIYYACRTSSVHDLMDSSISYRHLSCDDKLEDEYDDTYKREMTMHFKDATIQNSGEYKCIALQVPSMRMTDPVSLLVVDCPAKGPVLSLPNGYTIEEAIYMSCAEDYVVGSSVRPSLAFVFEPKSIVIGDQRLDRHFVNQTMSEVWLLPSASVSAIRVICRSTIPTCPTREARGVTRYYYLAAAGSLNISFSPFSHESCQVNCNDYITSNPPAYFTWSVEGNLRFKESGPTMTVYGDSTKRPGITRMTCNATNKNLHVSMYLVITCQWMQPSQSSQQSQPSTSRTARVTSSNVSPMIGQLFEIYILSECIILCLKLWNI